MITFEDFKKLDLRIARILEVEKHPDADKLYIIKIAYQDKEKQLVAGIRQYYEADELIGKQIVVVDNLEPVSIRGVESQGMLLAAKDVEGLTILTTDREVQPGSKVS